MKDLGQVRRNGQWLELHAESLAAATTSPASRTDGTTAPAASLELEQPRAGSHPHAVRQWLLARSLFPHKWVNKLFSVGGMRWNGDRLQLLAYPPADIHTDPLYRKASLQAQEQAPKVLYEDDFCMVLHKPAGMPVHESSPGQRGTLDEAAARHMLLKGDPLTIRHIHRLDDDTSGPVLYAINDLAQLRLDEAMRQKDIDRQYIAVVHGRVSKQAGTINLPIGKDRHHRAKRRVSESGEHAITHYEILEASKQLTLLSVRLETGRTHQIRVHMSHIGHPLLGDGLYGGDARLLPHQALHGERLVFPHPWSNERITVEAPWPSWLEELAQKVRSQSK